MFCGQMQMKLFALLSVDALVILFLVSVMLWCVFGTGNRVSSCYCM